MTRNSWTLHFEHAHFVALRLAIFSLNLVLALQLRDSVLFSDEAVQLQNLRMLAAALDPEIQPFASEWQHPMPNFAFLLLYAPLQLLNDWDQIRAATVLVNCLLLELAAQLMLNVMRACVDRTSYGKLALLYLAVYLSPFANYSGMIMTESAAMAAAAALINLVVRLRAEASAPSKVRTMLAGFAAGLLVYVKVQLALLLATGLALVVLTSPGRFRRAGVTFACGALVAALLGQLVNPVAGLGGYAKDVAPYSLANPFHIASTVAFGLISAGLYSLLLFPVVARTALVAHRVQHFNQAGALLLRWSMVATVAYVALMSVHAVSNIDRHAPGSNIFMLHERVYAFLLPMQFSCVLFAGPAISRRQMLGIALALLLVPLAGAAVDGRQFDPIADIAGPPLAFLAAQMALPRAWTIALLLSAACLVTWATILQRRDPFVLGLSVALVFSLVLRAGTYVELRHRHWWPDASGAPTAHLSTVRGPLYVVTDAGIPSLFLSMVDNRVTQVPMRAEQLREAILKSTVPTPLMAVVPGAMAASVLTEYDAVIIAGYPRFNASVVEIRRAP